VDGPSRFWIVMGYRSPTFPISRNVPSGPVQRPCHALQSATSGRRLAFAVLAPGEQDENREEPPPSDAHAHLVDGYFLYWNSSTGLPAGSSRST
jgi:hypothetical protein